MKKTYQSPRCLCLPLCCTPMLCSSKEQTITFKKDGYIDNHRDVFSRHRKTNESQIWRNDSEF